MEVKITEYKTGDYDNLVSLWEAASLPYKPKGRDSRESIENEVKLDCNQFLFAEMNGRKIGTVLVTHDGRKGWINRVAVLPEYRLKGIGWKLVKAAENWLDQEGIGIYACQIEAYNEESFKAFQKMGYVPFEGIRYLTKRKFPDI